ncbi:MAG TPA: carboxypeptidase regulatory-like domain-containing protein [Longimicrobiales bacterium]|nr:carboxypeptidase regulatory-like domain-containing protein [Longimicrobiales bacterium]
MNDSRVGNRRNVWLVAAVLALGATLGATRTAAQQGARITGVVFDSTSMQPLPGARIAVLGTSVLGDADATGFFDLSGVPAGSHWVSFFHPRLQALGVSPPSRQVVFQDGQTVDVVLAVPSDRTLLMGWCMAEQAGASFGALAGLVLDSLTGVPLPGAVVQAQLASRRPGDPPPVEVRTDDAGYYRLCTVPAGRDVRVQAHFGENPGRSTNVVVESRGAEIKDLVLFMSAEGSLVGKVMDYATGEAIAGAEVSVLGTEARQLTDAKGEFVLAELPPGRHLVATEFLGYQPRTDSVTVFSQETVDIELRLSTEAIELEGLTVTSRTRFGRTSIANDKRADVLTRMEIEPLLARVQSMGDLLRAMNAPGLRVAEVMVTDASGVAVPGWCVEVSRRTTRSGSGCSQAAVFVNDVLMPYPDQILTQLSPIAIDRIEILSPIDANAQFGNAAANGAVLIYTR